MANFDEIVTDPRLTLDLVESHLASLSSDAYLMNRYHALASSGSSGRRGVFVFDWSEWAMRWLSNVRVILHACTDDANAGSAPVMAMVAAADPTHGTSALSQTFSTPRFRVARFPVNSALDDTVTGLNGVQPSALVGYPSSLLPLTTEARAGRLRIRPRCVVTTSEPLTDEARATLEETWGVPARRSRTSGTD